MSYVKYYLTVIFEYLKYVWEDIYLFNIDIKMFLKYFIWNIYYYPSSV